MVTIVPPARAVWLDLQARTERLLEPGRHELDGDGGFVWVDVELPAEAAVAALAEAGLVPAGLALDEEPAGRLGAWYRPDHLEMSLAGARLEGDGLVLDRRLTVVTDGAVVTLHRGLPEHFDDLRARYQDGFQRFARSHGFLLYELVGDLTDGLELVARGLGDRIDDLRLAAARPAAGRQGGDGAELLASVLVMRRVLARTRDVLAGISSRRSSFVPETTQPFLHDLADRVDGLVADLAFSRDVLDEALRLTVPGGPQGSGEGAAAPPPAPGRPPLAVVSLGGFQVHRAGMPLSPADLGGERAGELLAALLSARRPVHREQLLAWVWPDEPPERGTRALAEAAASLRTALGTPGEAPSSSRLVAEGPTHRVELDPADSWDVDELLRTDGRDMDVPELEGALDRYGRPFCPEWPDAEWGRPVREDCARALAGLRARLAEALLAGGRGDEAIAHFEALVELDPENEAGHRGLMRCHAEAGQMPLALRQFHTCRSILRQTQGVDPSPETQALYLELLGRR